MKMHRTFFAIATSFFAAAVFPAAAQPAAAVASAPVYVPDYSHQNEPLPDGVLAWDELTKSVDATNGQDFARFVFAFTNVAAKIDLGLATNVTSITNFTTVTNTGFWARFMGKKYAEAVNVIYHTNVVTVTNSVTLLPVTILDVHPSCGCTTAELPARPWLLPPGTNSIIKVAVNLAGKSGIVFKSVNVATDKGKKDLMLRINIAPPPPVAPMSEEERARGVAAAKLDRQAVFKGDCVSCHAKNLEGKYGQPLFASVCAVCHEANPRATMVPDLHNLKDATSEEFWRTWITSGKAGTLMPAFATSQGGPLNDMQIASLAAYLNAIIPPHARPEVVPLQGPVRTNSLPLLSPSGK
jgi:mono/diheme cytochrome c family protein